MVKLRLKRCGRKQRHLSNRCN
uniref:30S ribosomal protein S16, chloroplastic n=1 Tax=Rubus innominatus TaxID=421246 RepID=A0A7T7CNT0_9ROSA|nr:ribosomal protein S16 [Rubus innominatus]QQK91443.1 ribosomal protein S16 [Rubus innominatus]